jgi:photosystem II stability/assembly factor-like uncharacterized protein
MLNFALMRRVAVAAMVMAIAPSVARAGSSDRSSASPSVAYTWKSVQIVGGGFVDGIVFHPTEPGLRYARTDIGGAYRWDEPAKRWMPLMDWVSYDDVNLMGVEGIALDPADANRLYLVCGMYTADWAPNAAVLRSDDRGRTFARINLPFKMGGNEDGRGNGPRMAVDPNNGKIIYLGTRNAGLWRSTDRGATWAKVSGFPGAEESAARATPPGIVVVLFDPRSAVSARGSSTIYAGLSEIGRSNFFRSSDFGNTWTPLPGEPTKLRPLRGALAADGTIYLSYANLPGPSRMTDGAIWKFDTATGQWTDITPQRPDPEHGQAFGYDAVAVDARNPKWIQASTFYRPDGDDIFRSTNGGATWRPIFHAKNGGTGTFDYSIAPYTAHSSIHWLFDIPINPLNSDHAIFTTGYGGWETFDLTNADAARPTHWSVMANGIEETVALGLISPPTGAHLLSAIGDYGGFVHWDLDRSPAAGNFDHPHFNVTSDLAFATKNPLMVVRVGAAMWGHHDASIGYSLGGGKTWQPANAPKPSSKSGSVAVGADGQTWVWTPQGEVAYFSRDRGAHWTACNGLPADTRVIADSENPNKFYAMALLDGKFFRSNDGAANFSSGLMDLPGGLPLKNAYRGDPRGGQDRLYATPGKQGDLWIAAFDGLFHSVDGGTHFSRLDGAIEEIHAFGFGKGKEAGEPAIYLVGKIDGQRGVYRSVDAAKSWVRINDDQHQFGLILQICGDPRIYGRVYVGTHGRGILYGDPTK